jgi:NAD+--dinitrogen-reductase ADP-D-ribosyltransferase
MRDATLTHNRLSIPSWAIASPRFNEEPVEVEVQGVRRAHRALFERLAPLEDGAERGRIFHDYMDVAFQLHQWEREESEGARKSIRNSYLRYLRGWLFDSNSVEGAVLKGWVESRIGIPPTFHRVPIGDLHSEGYGRYVTDRTRGMARTNAILDQLDVLYEFVQQELRRRLGGVATVTLWRGVHDFSEHLVLEQHGKGRCRIRLNNLNSFTDDFERAFEFGTKVLEATVATPKVFFRGDLLPRSVLKGEGEFLVIGGDYDVRVRTC